MSDPAAPAAPVNDASAFTFEGAIPPRRIPVAYRVTLGLTAFAVVLLPLVYIALIVASGYGIYRWAVFGLFLFSGSGGGFAKLVAYIAPLFAGGTLIVFMIKPLFAKPAKHVEPLTLDLGRYPELRQLIAAICAKVGAPMPVRVDVDCQVNASAGLRRGLWSLGRRDLVLTIGLPLVLGLSARQLAGVLAHEFGHFAQGAGMAFTYVIRSINAWFARVVFERDHWDESLARWSEGGDFRIQLVVGLARGAVWLTRKLLHGLMLLAHAITCLQLRQMEYDADYYEIQVAGTDDFIQTSREIVRLGIAGNIAFQDLGELWQTRQLVENFPDLVAVKRAHLASDDLEKIDRHAGNGKTGWFDTHPSNADRNAEARRLALPGLLRCDAPASAFFPDLPEIARAATRHFYRGNLGLTVDDASLVSTENARQAGTAAAANEAARDRLAGTVLDLTRPLLWQDSDFTPPPDLSPATLSAALAKCRAELDAQRSKATQETTTYGSILEHLQLAEQAHALLSASVKINPRIFNLAKSDLGEAEAERDQLNRRLAQKIGDLKPFESAVHDWIACVGQAARANATAGLFSEDARNEVLRLTSGLASLNPWFSAFPGWQRQQVVLGVFFANHKSLAENKKFIAALQARFDEGTAVGQHAVTMIGDAAYPLPTSKAITTAADLLRSALEGVEGANRLIAVMETVAKTYFRVIGRLAALGEDLERALAAPPAAPSTAE